MSKDPDCYVVRIPTQAAIQFPPRCIYCDAVDATAREKIKINYLTKAISFGGEYYKVEIPICKTCSGKSRKAMAGRIFFGLLIWGFFAGAYFLLIKPSLSNDSMWKYLVFIAFLIVLKYTTRIWSSADKHPYGITPEKEMTVYSFDDSEYAREFAALNNAKVEAH